MSNTTTAPTSLVSTTELGVTEDDMKKLRHMLGATDLRKKGNWGYRNYYAASKDSVPGLERLVGAGLCVRGAPYTKPLYYHATAAGCAAAGLSKDETNLALED